MTVRLARWKSPEGRAEYFACYDEALSLWPVPRESLEVPTPYGPTHVLASGPRDAPPLVLLHAAFNLGGVQWYANVARLARRHRVYAVDFVGAPGKSTQTKPILRPADAAAWLAGLLEGLGIERASLVGSSQGGWLALNLAVHAPERSTRLVLLAPAASFRPLRLGVVVSLRLGPFMPPWTARHTLKPIFGRRHKVDPHLMRLLEASIRHFRIQDRPLFPHVFGDDELRAVTARTLVMVGDHEMIYDHRAVLERAARLLPNVEAELVANGGHLFHMEQAERTDARILRFLEAAAEA